MFAVSRFAAKSVPRVRALSTVQKINLTFIDQEVCNVFPP